MDKKGIEIFNKDAPKGISITIGNTKVDTQGKPISIRFEKQMAYVYLLIDCSGSMAGNKLEQAKKGSLDFSKDAFLKEYLVGLIGFDTEAKHICEPTSDISLIRSRLEHMISTGTTNMADAIIMAHHHLKNYIATRVIVIATDGQPNNVEHTLAAGNRAKSDKIDIITIGTDDADQGFLKKLASQTHLGNKVSIDVFSQSISSTVKLLPSPKNIVKRK
jgi:Mg-chelatase subunit ChlD